MNSNSSSTISPLAAKTMAAATGATLTALTMTPFDVIKTRLQTQPTPSSSTSASVAARSSSAKLIPPNVCCQPSTSNNPCVRQFSSLALPASTKFQIPLDFRSKPPPGQNLVCLWDKHGIAHSERVTGFWDAGLKVWRMEGVRGLWKGVGTTLIIAVPSQTAYMVTYDNLKNSLPLPTSLNSLSPLISGVMARTFVSSMSSPLELLRTRLQSTPSNPFEPHTMESVLAGVRNMVRSQGPQTLWKGLGPTLWRDVPFSGVYWLGFETIKSRLYHKGFEGPGVAFVSGAVSGTLAAFLTSPFDVLKTRRQVLLEALTSDQTGKRPVTATVPLLLRIVRKEGPKALFAGLTPRMAKIAPACGIMISCYESVEYVLGLKPAAQ